MAKDKKAPKNQSQSHSYPPIVTVLGHVDHGKTTLLDAIRKTNIAQREHGGITQGIGASSIEISHEGANQSITFIDTPGHETFSKMRSRGAKVADIGLLIVSTVDGVMPQTKESIQTLKVASIPYIVVLTKSDVAEKNQAEKVKQQLLKEGIMLEGLGGDVPYISVSAKTGDNIKGLLDLILLVFDMQKKDEGDLGSKSLFAIVIESKLDEKAGPKATAVIKAGSLAIKDELIAEGVKGKVKMLTDALGKRVQKATVGEAVEILGFTSVPPVGSIITPVSEKAAAVESLEPTLARELVLSEDAAQDTVSIVLSADTFGSLEAIYASLPSKIIIIAKKTGEITPADILLAKSVGALCIGFNVKIRPDIIQLARNEKVLLKNYTIIYELLSELSEVLEGKALALEEQILGKAKVLASFPYEKTKVLGVKVIEGRIAKGDKVRVMRGETIVGEGTITSVRQGKESISKVESGHEAGAIISPLLDFEVSDVLICHN